MTQKQWKTFVGEKLILPSILNQSKTSARSAVNFKKQKSSMSFKPELMIWSRDTGQLISYFNSCQFTITWMSNIKDTRCKPRPQDLVLIQLGAIARDPCRQPCLPWEKSGMGFYFYVACDPVPIVMGLCLAALGAAGAPLYARVYIHCSLP